MAGTFGITIPLEIDVSKALPAIEDVASGVDKLKTSLDVLSHENKDSLIPGYVRDVDEQISITTDNVDKLMSMRSRIDMASSNHEREIMTKNFVHAYNRAIQSVVDLSHGLQASKDLGEMISTDVHDIFSAALTPAASQLKSAFNAVARNTTRRMGGTQPQQSIIGSFLQSPDLQKVLEQHGLLDASKGFSQDVIGKLLEATYSTSVSKMFDSKYVDWISNNKLKPRSIRERLPEKFRQLSLARDPQRSQLSTDSLFLTPKENEAMKSYLLAHPYVLREAEHAGIAKRYNGQIYYNPNTTRAHINAFGGQIAGMFETGVRGGPSSGIASIEDEKALTKRQRSSAINKNNELTMSSEHAARFLSDTFGWFTPEYIESQKGVGFKKPTKNAESSWGKSIGKMGGAIRQDAMDFYELDYSAIKDGKAVIPAWDDKTPYEERPFLRVNRSMMQNMLSQQEGADKFVHNGLNRNEVYIKLPNDELSDYHTTPERKQQIYDQMLKIASKGASIDGLGDYVFGGFTGTHMVLTRKDLRDKIAGNKDTRDFFFNGETGELDEKGNPTYRFSGDDAYKKFAKAMAYQKLLRTEGESVEEEWGTDLSQLRVVVGDLKKATGNDGMRFASSSLFPKSFQHRDWGGKGTTSVADLDSLWKMYPERIAQEDNPALGVHKGDLVFPTGGVGKDGKDAPLVIPAGTTMVEDMSLLKTKGQYQGLSQEELNAKRTEDLKRYGILAKTTSEGFQTDVSYISAQEASTLALTPEARDYFRAVGLKTLAKLKNPDAVKEMLFSGDDALSKLVQEDEGFLNSEPALERIRSFRKSATNLMRGGNLILPQGTAQYAMLQSWLPDVFGGLIGEENLTDEQKKMSLSGYSHKMGVQDAVAYFAQKEEDILQMYRNPSTAGGNITAANAAVDEYFRDLADMLHLDKDALYLDPKGKILPLMQGADVDGDTAFVAALNKDKRFGQIMLPVLAATAERFKSIRSLSGLTDEEQAKRIEAQKGKLIDDVGKEYSLLSPEDSVAWYMNAQKRNGMMGLSHSVSLAARQLPLTQLSARAQRDVEGHYDAVSNTGVKDNVSFDPTQEEWDVVRQGSPFYRLFEFAKKSIKTHRDNDTHKLVDKFNHRLFNDRNIDKMNFSSMYDENAVLADTENFLFSKLYPEEAGQDAYDWSTIFKAYKEANPVDEKTDAGIFRKAMLDLKESRAKGEWLVLGKESQRRLNALAQKAYAEIAKQVSEDPAFKTEEEREKETLKRYNEIGGQTLANELSRGITAGYESNKEFKAEIDSIAERAGASPFLSEDFLPYAETAWEAAKRQAEERRNAAQAKVEELRAKKSAEEKAKEKPKPKGKQAYKQALESGMPVSYLQTELGLSETDARERLDTYAQKYPDVKKRFDEARTSTGIVEVADKLPAEAQTSGVYKPGKDEQQPKREIPKPKVTASKPKNTQTEITPSQTDKELKAAEEELRQAETVAQGYKDVSAIYADIQRVTASAEEQVKNLRVSKFRSEAQLRDESESERHFGKQKAITRGVQKQIEQILDPNNDLLQQFFGGSKEATMLQNHLVSVNKQLGTGLYEDLFMYAQNQGKRYVEDAEEILDKQVNKPSKQKETLDEQIRQLDELKKTRKLLENKKTKKGSPLGKEFNPATPLTMPITLDNDVEITTLGELLRYTKGDVDSKIKQKQSLIDELRAHYTQTNEESMQAEINQLAFKIDPNIAKDDPRVLSASNLKAIKASRDKLDKMYSEGNYDEALYKQESERLDYLEKMSSVEAITEQQQAKKDSMIATFAQRSADLEFRSQETQIQRDRQYQQQRRQAWGGSHSRFVNAYLRQEDMRMNLEAQKRTADRGIERLTNKDTGVLTRLEKERAEAETKYGKGSTQELAKAQELKEATQQLEDYKKASEDAALQMSKFGTGSTLMRAGLSSVNDTMGMLLKRFGRQIFMKAINEAKQFVKQYDKTMTEIQMITLKSDSEMAQVSDSIINKAKEMKVSVTEVSQSAATLYRQGLSDQEVEDRLGVVSKFSKVSGTKVADATKLITIAMNTGLVSNAMEASDIVTALGDNAATNAQQIEKGIEKAGAAAAADGTTFGQLAAMLTAITSTTQIGGNVAGRTLNTIFGRMNKIGTNELIIDENGNKISGSAVANLLKAQGINMYDENGKKRSSFDTLYALSKKWEGMSDAEQQQIANAIAGTRQYSNFAAIMQGMTEGKIDDYLGLIGESSGITNKKFDVYKKSLEANLTDLKNVFDSTINDLVDKGVFTDIVTGIKDMITGIGSLVSSAGGLNSLVLGLGSIAILMGFIRGGAPGALAAGLLVSGLSIAGAIGSIQRVKASNTGKATKEKATELIENDYSNLQADINTVKSLKNKENLTAEEKQQLKDSLANIAVDSSSSEFKALMSSIEGAGSAALSASKSLDSYTDSIINQAEQINERNKLKKMMEINYGAAAVEEVKETRSKSEGKASFDNPIFSTIFGKPNVNGSYSLTGKDILDREGYLGYGDLSKYDAENMESAMGGLYRNVFKGQDYDKLMNDKTLTNQEKEYIKNGKWEQFVSKRIAPSEGMMKYVNKYIEGLYSANNVERNPYIDIFKKDISSFAGSATPEQLDALANAGVDIMQRSIGNGQTFEDAYNTALASIIGATPSQSAINDSIKTMLMKINPDLAFKYDSTVNVDKNKKTGNLGALVSGRILSSKEMGYKTEYAQLLERTRQYPDIGSLGATYASDYQELIENSGDTKLIDIWQNLQNNTGKYKFSDLINHLENALYGASDLDTRNKLFSSAYSLSEMKTNLSMMNETPGGNEALYKTISSATNRPVDWVRKNWAEAVANYSEKADQVQSQYEADVRDYISKKYNIDQSKIYTDESIALINEGIQDLGFTVSKRPPKNGKEVAGLDFEFNGNIPDAIKYSDLYDYSKTYTKRQSASIADKVKGLTWEEAISGIGKGWTYDDLIALQQYNPDLVKYMKMDSEQRKSSEGQKLLESAQNQIALDNIDTSTVSGVQQYAALKYQQNNKAGLAANRIYESMSQFNPEGIQSLGDLSNVLSSGNVDDWKTLLENNDELAKKMADAGITFDETSGKFDASGLVGGADAASSALQALAAAVAGASEAYSKQQEVLSEGETRERALAYSSGNAIDEELGFAAYSEAIGNSRLAQVVRNNRVAYDAQVQAYNDYMAMPAQARALMREQGENVPTKPGEFDAFEGLTDYEREYAQALEQNLAEGITGGLTAEQREEQTQKLLEAAKKGPEALQEMRSQDSIGAIQDYLTGIQNGEDLLNDIANGGKNAELALKKFQEQVNDRQAANLTKYSKNGSNLATALSKIKKGGKDASEGMAMLKKDMKKYQDQMTAVSNAKGKSGKQLDAQTKEILASLFDKISAEDIREMSKEELTDLLQGSEDEINAAFTESLQAIMDQGLADAKATGIDFDLSSVKINANGSPDFSSLDPAIAEILNAAWAKLQALAGTIGTAEIQEITSDNFMKLVGVVTKGNGYNSGGGGGGGGGGKSKVDKLIEKQTRKSEKLQHKQNMNQIYEGQYDYNNDYSGLNTNYDSQIAQEKKMRDQHLKNIEKYKKLLKKTKKADERKKLQQQIEKEEEEAAKAQNNINEIEKKQRITMVEERLTNRAKPLDQKRSMLDIYASRAEIRGNFNDYLLNAQASMTANKEKQAMNNADIEEWKKQLAQVAQGSDTWIEIRDKIYAKEQENAQLENDYLQAMNDLVQKRLENIAKKLQQTTQITEHNKSISDIFGSYYETAGYRREYEDTIRQKQEGNANLIARNNTALQEAYEELASIENNPELGKYSDRWYDAEAAVNEYSEAIAQLVVEQRELNSAMVESNIAKITEQYSDATSEITHTNELLSKFAEEALKANDFEAYIEAQSRIIENMPDKVNAAFTQVQQARALFDSLQGRDDVDPADIRNARDALQEAENAYQESIIEEQNASKELVKNTVELFTKQSDFELSNLEHNKKLFDYKASQYQNRGEYTNYGEALKADNQIQEMLIQTYNDRIDTWNELIKMTEKGSEEEKQLTELIKKDEEAIASSTATIEKNTKALEENEKKIVQVTKTLQDSVDKEIEAQKKREREMLSANVSMQNTILEVLKKRLQEEWDLKKKDIEKEKEALNEYKKLINERFNYRKKASQQADKDEELADYRRQLALIEADPTRTKDAKELRRKIEELEKQQAWTVAEDELNVENKRIDDEIDGMNKFVQYNEQILKEILGDANNFAADLNEILSGTFEESYAKIIDFMEKANSDFIKKLPDAQKQMVQSLEDTWKKANGIIDNNFPEIAEILGAYNSDGTLKSYEELSNPEYLNRYLDYMKNIDVYYQSAVEKGDLTTARKYELEWTETFNNFLNSRKNDFTFTMDEHTLREVESMVDELEDNIFKVDIIDMEDYLGNAITAEGYLDDDAKYIDRSTGETYNGSDYSNIGKDPAKVEKIKTSSGSSGNSGGSSGGSSNKKKKIVDTKWVSISATKHEKVYIYSDGSRVNTGITEHHLFVNNVCTKCGYRNVTSSGGGGGAGGTLNNVLMKYASGGLVDYTGPAWVDGTKADPEAFLSAVDTKNIRTMLDAFNYVLSSPYMSNYDSSAYSNETNIGDINITINQAELASDADVNKLAKQVGQAFSKELQRNGLNLAGYAFG